MKRKNKIPTGTSYKVELGEAMVEQGLFSKITSHAANVHLIRKFGKISNIAVEKLSGEQTHQFSTPQLSNFNSAFINNLAHMFHHLLSQEGTKILLSLLPAHLHKFSQTAWGSIA